MSENTSDYFDNYSAGLAALAREYPDIEPHFGQSIPGLVPTLADEEVAPFLASLIAASVSPEVDQTTWNYTTKLHRLIQDFLTARRLDQPQSSRGLFQRLPSTWTNEK